MVVALHSTARLHQPCARKQYVLTPTLDYDTSQFGGKKKLILSTTKWSIGGKNYSLGTIYLLFGGLYCLLAVLFMVKQTSNPRYGRNFSMLHIRLSSSAHAILSWSPRKPALISMHIILAHDTYHAGG